MVFDESEVVYANDDNEAEKFGTLTIPQNLEEGTYRMRVRSGVFFDGLNPCGFHLQTETLDFNLEVVAEPVTPKLQFINNYEDSSHEQLSLYINNHLNDELTDISFRASSGFIQIPYGETIDFKVTSTNQADGDFLYEETVLIEEHMDYIVIANNNIENQNNPFELNLFNEAKTIAYAYNETDLLFYNGSSNVGELDFVDTLNEDLIIPIDYSEFNGYFGFKNQLNEIGLALEGDEETFVRYLIPVSELGINNQAATIISSGILSDPQNPDEDFGLWLAKVSGGELIPLLNSNLSSEVFENNELLYYPNPVNSILYLESLITINTIKVYNMLGQLIQQNKVNSKNFELNMSNFAKGIYLINLENINNKKQNLKVVKD